MNKEIKFKAYWGKDGVVNRVDYPALMTCDKAYKLLPNGDSELYTLISIVQYTGLKSSDGGCNLPIEEAYFDDIVEFYNTEGKRMVAVIVWDNKLRCISFKRVSDCFLINYEMINHSGYFQPSELNFQIIGNIYQNPELLNTE